MNVLFLERNLTADSLVYDQIQRIGNHVQFQVLSVRVGRHPPLLLNGVCNVFCPFFPKLEFIKGLLFVRSSIIGFRRLQKLGMPNLVHSHFAYPEGLAAYKISKRYQIPYIITVRGSDILMYPKSNSYLRKVISITLENCSGLIAVSDHLKEQAISLGTPPDNCTTQPDGIPTEFFSWSKENEKRRSRDVLLFVGRLISEKNVMIMIDALAKVVQEKADVRLVIAGKGPLETEMRAKLSKIVNNSNFEFLGHLSHSRLAAEMKNATLLLLPSKSEGWPNVIMEAMACGTPVIASKVGGIPEQITSETFGLLCSPNSVEDMAMKIITGLKKNWDHKRIANHGQKYKRADTALKITQFYQRMLDRLKE